MEGIFISLIVFAAILGCVIYYGIIKGKFGKKMREIVRGTVSLPTRALEEAGYVAYGKSKRLGNILTGTSKVVGGITSAVSTIPLTIGAAGFELGSAVTNGLTELTRLRKRRPVINQYYYNYSRPGVAAAATITHSTYHSRYPYNKPSFIDVLKRKTKDLVMEITNLTKSDQVKGTAEYKVTIVDSKVNNLTRPYYSSSSSINEKTVKDYIKKILQIYLNDSSDIYIPYIKVKNLIEENDKVFTLKIEYKHDINFNLKEQDIKSSIFFNFPITIEGAYIHKVGEYKFIINEPKLKE